MYVHSSMQIFEQSDFNYTGMYKQKIRKYV